MHASPVPKIKLEPAIPNTNIAVAQPVAVLGVGLADPALSAPVSIVLQYDLVIWSWVALLLAHVEIDLALEIPEITTGSDFGLCGVDGSSVGGSVGSTIGSTISSILRPPGISDIGAVVVPESLVPFFPDMRSARANALQLDIVDLVADVALFVVSHLLTLSSGSVNLPPFT